MLYQYFLGNTISFSTVSCMTVFLKAYVDFLFYFMYLQHQQPNPAEEWLEEKAWSEIVSASGRLRSFQGFMGHFKDHLEEWKNFYDSANPMEVKLPNGYEKLE